jgi:hypothetical protein
MIWMKPLLHALVSIEPWLNVVVLLVVLKAGLRKRFPATTFYFGFRCLTDAVLYFVLIEHHFISVSLRTQTLTYIYGYWACSLLGAVAIFFALQEIFKAVMAPVPGLQRLGLLMFRWVSIATVIILIGMAILPTTHRYGNSDMFFVAMNLQIARCLSIVEICLLAYLALSVHSLGRSFRGRVFGIGLGFGLEASGQLLSSIMLTKPQSLWCLGNLLLEFASMAALLTWTTYFLLPEPQEEAAPITLPVTSPLLRWNDIASALGQRPAHVSLGAPSSAFFLQDVEQVVDKFLTRVP